MTIEVQMTDGTYCRVVPKGLDLLLRHDRIKRFRRSSGWAVVGIDSLRSSATTSQYNGPEWRVTN